MTSKEMTEKQATVKNLEVRLEDVEENPGGFNAEEGDLDLIRWCLSLTKGLIGMLLEEERKEVSSPELYRTTRRRMPDFVRSSSRTVTNGSSINSKPVTRSVNGSSLNVTEKQGVTPILFGQGCAVSVKIWRFRSGHRIK